MLLQVTACGGQRGLPTNIVNPPYPPWPLRKLNDSKAIGDEILSVGNYYDPNCPSNTAYVVRFLPDGTVSSIVGQTFPFYCGFNKYVIDADNRLVILGYASYQNGTRNMLHSMRMEGDSIWTQFMGMIPSQFGIFGLPESCR